MENYTILYTDDFENGFGKLSDIHKKMVLNKIKILKSNPRHPSLRTKKIQSQRKTKNYESSVNMDIRLIWQFTGISIITIVDVGHHDILGK